MYLNITGVKFMFFDEKLSKSLEFYHMEPCLYPSITDIVEAMNTIIQQRHNHIGSCITVQVSRRPQKVEIDLAYEGFGLAFVLVRAWDTFSEVRLAMILERCREKIELTNQN